LGDENFVCFAYNHGPSGDEGAFRFVVDSIAREGGYDA